MSYATVQSCTVHGVGAISVSVEVHIAGGLPSVSLVGLPQSAVRESKDRVRAAIQNAGFDFPLVRVTVNLAPADLPKQGGRFDLPIALGIMLAKGYLPPDSLNNFCVIGELGLSGELRSVSGVLPSALALRNSEVQLLCPEANAKEAAQSSSTNIVCAANLSDVIHGLRSSLPEPSANTRNRSLRHWSEPQKPLFAGVSSTPQIRSAGAGDLCRWWASSAYVGFAGHG